MPHKGIIADLCNSSYKEIREVFNINYALKRHNDFVNSLIKVLNLPNTNVMKSEWNHCVVFAIDS